MSQSTFVNSVCNQVLNEYPELHRITLVVPAKRSIRFFSSGFMALLTTQKKAAILPEIITLTDLFDRLSPFSKLTQVELVFHFYEVYCSLETDPEPFETFFTWAPQLLADFNEVDNYMVSAKSMFTNLTALKEQEIEIEEWSFDRDTLSPGQQRLNNFWMKLPLYYEKLQDYLHQRKLGYSGMINRHIASNLKTIFEDQPDRIYVFAGFNALTKCESVLMHYLQQHNQARLFFDADAYYVDNPAHEAGLFIRNYRKTIAKPELVDANALGSLQKNIHFYESNGEAMQCSELVRLLVNLPKEQLERSAIVLCNEQLLPVLINSLPSSLLRVNVTMGWPLRFTAANDFFMALIDLNIAYTRSKTFIQRQVLDQFVDATAAFLNIRLGNDVVLTNREELNVAYASTPLNDLLEAAFQSPFEFIQKIIPFIKNKLEGMSDQDIHAEIYAHYLEAFHKLSLLPGFEKNVTSWYVFKNFFTKFTRNYPLAFVGEPLAGIQIMGMLETRALDFSTVFILSANEGYLPAQTNYAGYIPYDLRNHFHLPGKTEQDAVYAYYFYRLIQRASTVHVFYNTQNELLQQAERSRYLLQVEKELVEVNKKITVQTHQVDAVLSDIPGKFTVEKSGFYFERLNALMQQGFSATMLSTFARCQLDFYHKYILGFKTPKDFQQVDESDIGNMVHAYFESLFNTALHTELTHAFFAGALESMDKVLNEIKGGEKFKTYSFNSGQNFLAFQLVRKMVSSFLEKQMASGEFSLVGKTVEGTELKLECVTQVNFARGTTSPAQAKQIKLIGNIDLLLKDPSGEYFIYDFKTGRVEEAYLTVPSKLSIDAYVSKDKLIQLLLYKKLVAATFGAQQSTASIIPLATGSSQFFTVEMDLPSGVKLLEDYLAMITTEMMDATSLILHNEKSKFCEFCH
ncbi:MAG TPA: PD-(D/E)XK nuclease family protein [Flavobacteriales bacterium]|nr:PD-(D/E)XK nuclease family protein [Flavobacteriales bacterium]